MRILVSTIGDLRVLNGTIIRVKRIAKILSSKHRVTVVGFIKNGSGNLYNRVKINLDLLPRVFVETLKNKPDIIYCSANFGGFVAHFIGAKLIGAKLILETPGILSVEHKTLGTKGLLLSFVRLLERLDVTFADHVIAMSPNIYEFYKRFNRKISLVLNFIDTDRFKKCPKEGKRIRESLAVAKGEKLAGLIGPFDISFNRNYLVFLKSSLKRLNPKIKIMLIGRGGENFSDRRVLNVGNIDSTTPEYVYVLSSLDAMVVPSRIVTTGPLTKILEAMACSIPVFTTPKGMVGLYNVVPGRDVFVHPEHLLVSKLNEYIFDERRMNETGGNGRNTVVNYYSLRRNAVILNAIIAGMGNR